MTMLSGSSKAHIGHVLAKPKLIPSVLRASGGGKQCRALVVDQDPTFQQARQAADETLHPVLNIAHEIGGLQKELVSLQHSAAESDRAASSAETDARNSANHLNHCLHELRQELANLKDQQEEVSAEDLSALASKLLFEWIHSQNPDEYEEGPAQLSTSARFGDVRVLARTAQTVKNGSRDLVVAVVAGEKFPEGKLEGMRLHWGCGNEKGQSWQAPPAGWHTSPSNSSPAGRAWQTAFATYLPVRNGRSMSSDPAYGLVLQIPAQGILQKSGALNFVLKRPAGQNPEWLQSEGNRDFKVLLTSDKAANQAPQSSGAQWTFCEPDAALPFQHRSDNESGYSFADQKASAAALLEAIIQTESQGKEEGIRRAQERLHDIERLLHCDNLCQEKAQVWRREANGHQRRLADSVAHDRELKRTCQAAMRDARRAAAKLYGKEEEIGIADLTLLAETRLLDWLGWISSRNNISGTSSQDFGDLQTVAFRIHGLEGWLVCSTRVTTENGQRQAVLSIAAAEAFSSGALRGVMAHWGISAVGGRKGWHVPPKGWTSEPNYSQPQGGGATQTSFEEVEVPARGNARPGHAYMLVLQIPIGSLQRGDGVKLVLRTPSQLWLGCSDHGQKQDFFMLLKDEDDVKEEPQTAKAKEPALTQSHSLRAPKAVQKSVTQDVESIIAETASRESKAERSLMHRFRAANDLLGGPQDKSALQVTFVWLRFSAMRLLTWNRNYNIKPREISAAQDDLTKSLAEIYEANMEMQPIVRVALAAVGRGGQGEVGQRVRDEILSVQSRNNAKGGMMEEWHQKLHNNTSPDDVVICQALLAYLDGGLDIQKYWKTLQEANITKERLLSFDRAIRSEPNFSPNQVEGLTKDLTGYLKTLQAVHSGDDLGAAIDGVMGYSHVSLKGKQVKVEPVPGVANPETAEILKAALKAASKGSEDGSMDILKARMWISDTIKIGNQACGGRLRDVLFLDIALESSMRRLVEAQLGAWKLRLKASDWADVLEAFHAAAANAAFSSAEDQELAVCVQALQAAERLNGRERALWVLAVIDRLKRHCSNLAQQAYEDWQPIADKLGQSLRIPTDQTAQFAEEIVRSSPLAAVSQIMAILEPFLRSEAGLSSWQLISPVPNGCAIGKVVCAARIPDLSAISDPAILIVDSLGGEEDIPEGVVAVISRTAPDVLSHVAVRARNSAVLLAACLDPDTLQECKSMSGQLACLEDLKDRLVLRPAKQEELDSPSAVSQAAPDVQQLQQKNWCGKLCITAQDFSESTVGAKALNLLKLQGLSLSTAMIPSSIAIPFGTFEEVLKDPRNTQQAQQLVELAHGEKQSTAEQAQTLVQSLSSPPALEKAVRQGCESAGICNSLDWEEAWKAIKKVWASKWNSRAISSIQKIHLDHDKLQMSILCQRVIPAAYAFVSHTRHPTTGDKGVIYVELVQGLGELLVGNAPGAAFSYTANKKALGQDLKICSFDDCITISGFSSKSSVLMPNKNASVIFRSDSNAEDLQGFAGAGLFDSVQTNEPQLQCQEMSEDRLVFDAEFRERMLWRIARASLDVEIAFGAAQDIEGVIDLHGYLHIVQSRPQV